MGYGTGSYGCTPYGGSSAVLERPLALRPAKVSLALPYMDFEGTLATVGISIANESGDPVDVLLVELSVGIGFNVTPVVYTYRLGQSFDPTAKIVRDSPGEFHAEFDTTGLPGTYNVEVNVSGFYQGVAVGGFVVVIPPLFPS